jgi:hypothetical protein
MTNIDENTRTWNPVGAQRFADPRCRPIVLPRSSIRRRRRSVSIARLYRVDVQPEFA